MSDAPIIGRVTFGPAVSGAAVILRDGEFVTIDQRTPRPRMPVTPISPDVVSARVDIDHHVTKINNFLASPWSDYDRVTGRYYAVSGMTTPEREAVIKVFAGAGWNVKFWGDQRDGDALVFHPRITR